jgi:hypothetical protein
MARKIKKNSTRIIQIKQIDTEFFKFKTKKAQLSIPVPAEAGKAGIQKSLMSND